MRKVQFKISQPPRIEYQRALLTNELRDNFVQCLMRQCKKTLNLEVEKIENNSQLIEYIALIFEKALGPKLSSKELETLGSLRIKFSFLRHQETTTDDIIHGVSYNLIALCSGYNKVIEQFVRPKMILDSRCQYLDYKGDGYIGWDESRALCDDVAKLTRKCIKEFLQELRETGKIMTSAELAETHKDEVNLNTDYSSSLSDSDTEKAVERTSDSSAGSSGTATTQDSNNSNNSNGTQQRGISLPSIDKEESTDNDTRNNSDTSQLGPFLSLLPDFLSWVYQLPDWLQEKLLNSTPVKTLLEETKKAAAVHDTKYTQNHLAKLFVTEKASSSYALEDKQTAKVTRDDVFSEGSGELVDMTMILENPQIAGLILPTVAIEPGSILLDNGLNGLLNFNGLNGLEIF